MSQNFSLISQNRQGKFRDIMHINARDRPPSKPFCFIIEYTPYIRLIWGDKGECNIRIQHLTYIKL